MSDGEYNTVRGPSSMATDETWSSPSLESSPPPPILARPRRSSSTKSRKQSFSSVREDDSGLAQSFVVSSFRLSAEENRTVACNHITKDDMASTMTLPPPTVCCPCGHFNGWKHISLRGKGMSKSSGDLRVLGNHVERVFDWDKGPEKLEPAPAKGVERSAYPAGQSPLESLPNEILDEIMSLLEANSPSDGAVIRKSDLMSCMLSSKTLLTAAVPSLYSHATIRRSVIFSKFLEQLSRYPVLGSRVRRLDFSHFSSVGLGRTRRMNSEIQMVTSATLSRCLELSPQLREFLAQAHLDDDLDESVIRKLFYGSSRLHALDFCASSSENFKTAFATVISPQNPSLPATLNIKRLSLHECSTLSTSSFAHLFPRLPWLSHLDVAHTQVTDRILLSLPPTVRLTHLNLSGCIHVSGQGVIEFLTTHPAARESLVYLNLLSDVCRYSLLSEADLEALLPLLPSTLKSLNLSGSKFGGRHLPLLLPLTKHLEELSLGFAVLSMDEITSLFVPKTSSDNTEDGVVDNEPWVTPSLHYLDVTGIAGVTAGRLLSESCALLWNFTRPLEVLEVGEKVLTALQQRSKACRKVGWTVKEAGRRAWYVREPGQSVGSWEGDSGRRSWKMGANWWGMRKVPVANSDVGGLYGHYMFKYKPAT
ncbi:MAG: hypothetical protein M1837_004390 [Sclerophora amabilis]|nr:MAG: hypothetical protein M1837_004390 [Sclerophora amabilis]